MPVNGLDAMAQAITQFEGRGPTDASVRNNNPGNLRVGGITDAKGYSIFRDFISGYNALLSELEAKFSGRNKHGIDQNSTLLQLLSVYAPVGDANNPTEYATFVAGWVAKALGKPITLNSKLGEIWTAVPDNSGPPAPPAPPDYHS